MTTGEAEPAQGRGLARLFAIAWEGLIRYALKFGVVGLLGYVIDVGIFNLLRVGAAGDGHFFQGPIGAKIVSVTVATVATWFGNRYWTFREHRRRNYLLELLEFAGVAVGGLGVGLLFLAVSHYLLGLRSLLADNISTNVVGLVLGTAFRFVLYRYWVYGHHRSDARGAQPHKANAAAFAVYEDDGDANEDASRA